MGSDPRATPTTIADVWKLTRAAVLDQVRAVEDLALDALSEPPTAAHMEQVGRIAHQLAGSLGSFGSAEASRVARGLEVDLAGDPDALDALSFAGSAGVLRDLVDALDARLTDETSGRLTGPAPAAPSMTVLSLDDDPTIGVLLTAIIAGVGGQVVAVQRVTDLWAALERMRPDAVLLDLDVPSANGIDLCRALRSDPRTATTPIIILTATPSGEAVQAAFAAGADDYITKPIVGPELLGRIMARHRGPDPGSAYDVDIAIVEDDAATAALLQHLLDRESLTWRRFEDGDEALALVRGDVRARVILLDVGLPGIDGFGVLRKLSAAGTLERSKVVMLTARSSEPEVLRALELGAADHIEKPFSLPILAHRIRRVLPR